MKVSLILPSRNEPLLGRTVADVLANARGDVEVLAVLDGGAAPSDLPNDPRVVVVGRTTDLGMRQAINEAAARATGDYLLKLDAHCAVADGFDVTLVESHEDVHDVVIPRRHPLDPHTWQWEQRTDRKYPVDAHYLSYPYRKPGDPNCGLHGDVWQARRDARADVLIDEEMSSQGSCWFMHRDHFAWLGGLDSVFYGPFFQEFQEIGNKTWLGGGRVLVNKKTWYAHLRKSNYKLGRGYSMADFRRDEVTAQTADYWMHTKDYARDLRWLVERFGPLPGWPEDLDAAFHPSNRYVRAGAACASA